MDTRKSRFSKIAQETYSVRWQAPLEKNFSFASTLSLGTSALRAEVPRLFCSAPRRFGPSGLSGGALASALIYI